ncbi:MAG: LacI family transcriptional regulator [Clostridiales bacterium]|nr:LacI family transcriptional regulator [Clostridiales bacterium]
MAKAVKLADIASALNVSTVTVSKALSGQKGVSQEMREKIIQVADELGYKQPSASVKPEKNQNSYYIGILIPEKYMSKYDSFYWQMYQELATKAVKKECFTMLEVLSEEDTEKLELPKLVKEQKVDGMIVIGRPGGNYIEVLRSIDKLPLLYLDFFDEVGNCDAVITNSFYGTYMLTNYLFQMGHKRIGYVGTLLSTGSITDRYFGYAKSLLEHGVEVRKDWIIEDRDVVEGLVGKGFEIVLPKEMPTAFVCNCDLTASEVIKRLKEKNLRVPEDISVVGFDNFLFPGLCDVPITTYEVDTREMARKSLQILIKKIRKEYTKSGVNVVEGQLIYRNSVKKLI